MALFPGWTAPDFRADTTAGPISFHSWLDGCWGIVIMRPGDFSPQTLRSAAVWAQSRPRPVKLLGLSSAGRSAAEGAGHQVITSAADISDFPIIRNDAGNVAALWRGVDVDVGPAGAPIAEHVVFVVDPARTIRTTLSYPSSRDRDLAELIRCVDALDINGTCAWRPSRAA
ncbi:thioredoxin domain-containing protein [Acidomonas methanolica]|uniref:peroxiredoxin n=1 Tax=Acidomonas methanolica TaxID=437 RepID=UPI00211A9170|nr:peroxiredoxin [Acidomonas methanolica]MCQ9156648.1 peroxiredoxin [Acidomonas methanolica]